MPPSPLYRVAMTDGMLYLCVAVCLQCVCSALQCVAVRCSALQCVAVAKAHGMLYRVGNILQSSH